jgi:hypothetical protein
VTDAAEVEPEDSSQAAGSPLADQFTPERALALLRKADISLQEFASNPRVFDAACKTVHRMLPPPARWVVREKGVRRVLERVRDSYVRVERQDEGV